MARPKGSKNKNSAEVPIYTALPIEDRITLLANLIVDQIYQDQENGGKLLAAIGDGYDAAS
jgi:hypothetical protein